MATKSLTGRQLIRQILNAGDIDAPVTSMNINASDDEFENESFAQEIVSVNDNSENGGNIVIYYLGDVAPTDPEDAVE